jgi:transposase-like protein
LPAGYAGREPKFSPAQKAAAIEHYLTHDRCIAATMRALGYPCRGTLTKWVREAFPEARSLSDLNPLESAKSIGRVF